MAVFGRPRKKGLDYFPFVTRNDDKLNSIVNKFRAEGLGVVLSLYQRIYDHGYYLPPWKEGEFNLFIENMGITAERYHEIISECTRIGLFDKGIYEEHGVLTSNGIQERYAEVSKRRRFGDEEYPYVVNDSLRDLLCAKSSNKSQYVATSDLLHTHANNCAQRKGNRKGKGKGKVYTNTVDSINDDTISKPVTNQIIESLDSSQGSEPRRVYMPGEEPYEASKWLIEQIKSIHPNARVPDENSAGFQKWCNTLRLMHERDKREWSDFYRLVEWMRDHDFWCSILLSAGGVREHWDKAWAQYQRTRRSKGREEEWQRVITAISRFGRNREDDAMQFLGPRTARIVQDLGWLELCNTTNIEQYRVRFFKAWR